jgi:hypothetical protein
MQVAEFEILTPLLVGLAIGGYGEHLLANNL